MFNEWSGGDGSLSYEDMLKGLDKLYEYKWKVYYSTPSQIAFNRVKSKFNIVELQNKHLKKLFY